MMVFVSLLKLTRKNVKAILILMTANPIIIKLKKLKKKKKKKKNKKKKIKKNKKKKKKKKKQSKEKLNPFFGIPRDFYSCRLYSSSSFFNLCSSWNING